MAIRALLARRGTDPRRDRIVVESAKVPQAAGMAAAGFPRSVKSACPMLGLETCPPDPSPFVPTADLEIRGKYV
jgi:hypothetical protein